MAADNPLVPPPLDNLERSFSKRYLLADRLLTAAAFLLLGMALLPLLLVVSYVLVKGAARLDLKLLTELPPAALQPGGGIGPAIQGTLLLVGLAAAMSLPLGILAGIYLSEFGSGPLMEALRFATNVLSGVPSIIVGIFAYGAIVLRMESFSAWAGGFALAILMLPLVVRTTDEALQLVPLEIRWASAGVGASHYHTVWQIVVPAAWSAILTGTTLAVARAAGETAPLIFTALYSPFWIESWSEPVGSLAVLVYNFATVPYQNQQELAWAASFILVLLVLLSSTLSRLTFRRRS